MGCRPGSSNELRHPLPFGDVAFLVPAQEQTSTPASLSLSLSCGNVEQIHNCARAHIRTYIHLPVLSPNSSGLWAGPRTSLPHSAAMATTPKLTWTETVSLSAFSTACGTILANTFRGEGEPLIASLALSGMAFAAAYAMIRWLGPTFMKAGLKGVDMSKLNGREIPECAGAICAIVYLLAIIVFTPFPFYKDIVAATSGGGNRDVVLHAEHVHEGRFLHKFPHSKVSTPADPPSNLARAATDHQGRPTARLLPVRDTFTTSDHHPWNRRRPL